MGLLLVPIHELEQVQTLLLHAGVTPAIAETDQTESQDNSQSQVRSITRVRKPPNRNESDFS